MCRFGYDFARNVVIFGVDDASVSHTDNQKIRFFVLGEGPVKGIKDNVGVAQKNLILTLVN